MTNVQVKIPNWLDFIFVCPLLACRLLRYGYPFRKIPLTQGYFAVVDPLVYYDLIKFKWRVCKNKHKKTLYAERSFLKPTGRYSRVLMHCQLMPDVPPGLLIDHHNGIGLDNRLANLRPATVAQNAWNSRPRKSRAGFKGSPGQKTKTSGAQLSAPTAKESTSATSEPAPTPPAPTTRRPSNITRNSRD